MIIKTPDELETLREGGHRLAFILQALKEETKAGVSTKQLDEIAERMIHEAGGEPSFKGYDPHKTGNPFPATVCISLNNEIVHGIPRADRIIADGEIITLDIGMWWGKLCTDTAITFGVGRITPKAEHLINVTQEALEMGIAAAQSGMKIGDISFAIQRHLERNNLTPVRELSGHGVGHEVHEEPLIPNYGKKGTGEILREGMVIALEPIASLGAWRIQLGKDGWTYRTADGSLSAHFEHTMVVTKDGAEVLTL